MITQKQQSAPPAKAAAIPIAKGVRQSIDANQFWYQVSKTLKGRFMLLAVCIFLVSLLLALFATRSFQQVSSDLTTISAGSVPSVDAAQTMAQYIEDIDAKSADYLATAALTTAEPCSLVGTSNNPGALTVHECDSRNIDAEIVLANQQLFIAAHNVTYPGEQTAIERITAGFEDYIAQIEIMRHEYGLAASATNIQDVHLQKARQAYIAANSILTTQITRKPATDTAGAYVFSEATASLPKCTINGRTLQPTEWALGSIRDNLDCLSYINKSHLDAAYNDSASFLGYMVILVTIFYLIFCLFVFGTTSAMVLVTHRIINIGLVLALLASIIFSIVSVTSLTHVSGRHGDFGQIVQDDYNSIYYAALLKKYGTDANADESRWLIAQEFGDQTQADHWQQDWQSSTTQVNLLIQQAKANRTWSEEDQPLNDMQTYWTQYFQIDGTIRSAANAKDIPGAERLSTGTSNQAFGNFSTAVDRLSQANRDHYASTLVATQQALTLNIYMSALLFPLMGLAAALGITRRLKDF